MEPPFSGREKGDGYWIPPRAQAYASPFLDDGARSSIMEDPINNFVELMSLDTYAGWCNSPSVTDQLSYGPSMPYAPFIAPNLPEQNSSSFPDGRSSFSVMGGSSSFGGKVVFQQMDSQFGFSIDSTEADNVVAKKNGCRVPDIGGFTIPRPISLSLADKMLKALSMFKESSGGGILAQVWAPVKHGEQCILSTYEQPYLLDHMLAGYREVSRAYTFSTEVKPGSFPGLPGRVFVSKVPEWTSNIVYYNNDEYLRSKQAADHDVHGSIALPVFDARGLSCCAVLELVTVKEKPNFDLEIENVCHALQAVNLRTSASPRLHNQFLSRDQKVALAEITDVLRAICHAHRLPLAMTWIPCSYTGGSADEVVKVCVREANTSPSEKFILCIEDTACYVNDGEMQGFVHACREHYLGEGQGLAGKALQSNHPFFFPDVKAYDINEYPLVHHAHKFGLNAAVAIRLRSTFTGNDDYILEFFLPVNLKGSAEQQLLLNNLSGTMQRMCRSLRTVSDEEIVGVESSCTEVQKGSPRNFPSVAMSTRHSQTALLQGEVMKLNISDSRSDGTEEDGPYEQAIGGPRRQIEKKQSTAEKNVSLSVLLQYFSGSLKDAAKSIGVCPTTLKRICRRHGILRWPSRKINKVNRSLRKIQTVLDSVQGVEGGLKFDPSTGEFVAAASIDSQKNLVFPEKDSSEPLTDYMAPPAPYIDGEYTVIKMEHDGFKETLEKDISSSVQYNEQWRLNNGSLKSENSDGIHVSQIPSTLAPAGITDHDAEAGDGFVEPTTSSLADSSNGSGSMVHGSSSSSQSVIDQNRSKPKTIISDIGSRITVKATYKEDTVRFKLEPSPCCFQLYEEVARRFKLQNGTFQLKYLDDEEEWVMLATDSDLEECLEMLESVGSHTVKFLVRDTPSAMGSSSSSNCAFLTTS